MNDSPLYGATVLSHGFSPARPMLRVWQVAKALVRPSSDVLAEAREVGLDLRSASSQVAPEVADLLVRRLTCDANASLVVVPANNTVSVMLKTTTGDVHNNVGRRCDLAARGGGRKWLIVEDRGISGHLRSRSYHVLNTATGERDIATINTLTNCW